MTTIIYIQVYVKGKQSYGHSVVVGMPVAGTPRITPPERDVRNYRTPNPAHIRTRDPAVSVMGDEGRGGQLNNMSC